MLVVSEVLSKAPTDSLTDYYAEFSEKEVAALREVVKNADGDAEVTETAREALGVYE